MRLKPISRFFADDIYRVSYFVIVSSAGAFDSTLATLLRRTNLDRAHRQKLLAAARESLGSAGMDGCNGRCLRLTPPFGGTTRYPVVILWCRTGSDVSVLVHEAWHAAYWVLRTRGVTFDGDGDEFQMGADEPAAYYLQWIVRCALGLTTT